jgi:DNA-binding transcriptional ArsR family regulator
MARPWLSKRVLGDRNLSPSARLLVALLNSYTAAERTGAAECWPGFDTLAKEAGMSERTLSRCVSELEKNGYVTTRRMGRRKVFRILTPARSGDSPDVATSQKRQETPDRNGGSDPPKVAAVKNQAKEPSQGTKPVGGQTPRRKPGKGGRTPPTWAPLVDAYVEVTRGLCPPPNHAAVAKAAAARWEERPDPDWWRELFTMLVHDRFMMGSNDSGWVWSLTWLLNKDKGAKLDELGHRLDRIRKKASPPPERPASEELPDDLVRRMEEAEARAARRREEARRKRMSQSQVLTGE